jgi:hypothetical protein
MTQERYSLRHETGEGRCAWCWELLGTTRPHCVIRASGAHPLRLRFHLRCWPIYRSVSGIAGREMQALYRQCSPQRVEALRLHAGLTPVEMAAKLHVSKDRLAAYLSGHGRLGQKALARLRGLAADTRFEHEETGAGLSDWGDRRAVFSLCMHCGWNAGELGRRLGVKDNTVTAWWDRGCPKLSVRRWGQLSALAKEHRFGAAMLVDDHLWTPELARAAVAASGLTRAAFATAAGCHEAMIRDACRGVRRLNRQMA